MTIDKIHWADGDQWSKKEIDFLEEEAKARLAITRILTDASVISVDGDAITIDSKATPKQVFDAEATLRKETGRKWEIMMGRMQDQNKLRIKLAKFRGVGGDA